MEDFPALGSMAEANQTILVTCGVDQKSSSEALLLARKFPGKVIAFVGVHPSEALKSRSFHWLDRALPRAAGLGEVGLDPTYSSAGPRGVQRKMFLAQLELAQKARKPVQVHSRKAEGEVIDALEGFMLPTVLLHWLESEDALPRALDKGYFLSFGPALLYSKKLQRMAARSRPDQVLTETDSPVQYRPLGAGGPWLVPSVVFKLAELWGVEFDEAREKVAANSTRYLGFGGKG
jgi:TatD DNase family protein